LGILLDRNHSKVYKQDMNKGQFKKGFTRHKPKPFWNKEWLLKEYSTKSASEIANNQNCHENNIFFWLNKHKIKTRTISEARKLKHWGATGRDNPMYGKIGKLNPNWNGGHSPERQSEYAKSAWKELAKSILKRDNYLCQKCNSPHTTKIKLIVHHIKAWSKYPELRFSAGNLITLCERCHKNEHRRK